jgi:hypothetical protein
VCRQAAGEKSFLSNLEAGLPDGFTFKPKIPIWVKFGGP